MSFSIGIVGLPNVGKSTLFKALTKKQVHIANYPFATIDPNVGVVTVPDRRLEELAKLSKSEKIVPTYVEFYDIAGLVAGAHKGEGLGNKFLSHIREVDAIAMVVRAFADPNIIHVAGRVDPNSDVEVIHYELIFADEETVRRRISDIRARIKSGSTGALEHELAAVEKVHRALEAGELARSVPLSADEKVFLRDLHLLTMKPMLYVLNVDEESLKEGGWKGVLNEKHSPQVAMNARIEAELADLTPEDAEEMIKELNLSKSGLDELIARSYEALGLITFITTGPMETKAWTVAKGAKAPRAAGVIHTDFEKGFIRAEVINWKDFLDAGGEVGAKEKGLIRLEGKEYIMQDGDVCHFRFSN